MVRKRISLTLDENLVKSIDREKKLKNFSNRSRAVESFLKNYFSKKSVNKAVILCGGEENTKKCLNIVDKKPLIEKKIRHLESYGVGEIIVAVGSSHSDIAEQIDKIECDSDIVLSVEENPLGTAGCLKNIKEKLKETFILTNGDILCEVDIMDMLRNHRKNGSDATMALTTMDNTSMYGVVKLKGNKVVGFEEKPDEAPTKLINAGFYLLEPDIIERIEEKEEEKIDIEEIFSELSEERKLQGYVYEGSWYDLGN